MRSAPVIDRVEKIDSATSKSSSLRDSRTDRYREAERVLWSQYGLRPSEHFVEVGSPRVRIRIVEVGSGPPLLFAHGTAGSGPAFTSLIHRPLHASVRAAASGASPPDRSAGSRSRSRRRRRVPHHCIIASPLGALFVRLIGRPGATTAMLRGNGHGPSLNNGRIPTAWVDWRTSVSRDTDSMQHERSMVRAIVAGSRYRPRLTMTQSELGAIPHPTLMLYGTREPVGSPSVWTHVMGAMTNGRLSLVGGAGHMIWLDEPARVAREMRQFLTG